MDYQEKGMIKAETIILYYSYSGNTEAVVKIRAEEYLHWWIFIGAYYEIGESAFSSIISIRKKKAQGKRLEKYEQEYYFENRDIVNLKPKYTEDEKGEIERLEKLIST